MDSVDVPPPEFPEGNASSEAVPLSGAPGQLRFIFAVAIFSGAFLLFFVELLLGKLILPRFGGTPAVWTTCLLVFQVLLLAGYAVAHWMASRLALRSQALIVLGLLGFSLILLAVLTRFWPTPITPGFSWAAGAADSPSLTIIRFLGAAIGFPFLLLSVTSPLLQSWWSKIHDGFSPYRFYALSNAGSLIGLLSYPFVFEPALRLSQQAWLWTAGYAAYASFFAAAAFVAAKSPSPTTGLTGDKRYFTKQAARPLGWQLPALWIALAACASIQLLATTNFICQEVAVIPFLWVLPLCIYLLSLILTFEGDRWYSRGLFHLGFAAAAAWVVVLGLQGFSHGYLAQLAACCALLFVGCMVCHGEAARLRPSPDRLTHFFLCISIGGALGGIFVSLIAPRIFTAFWEFPLAILGCATLLLAAVIRDRDSWWYSGRTAVAAAVAAAVVLAGWMELSQVWKTASKAPAWLAWVAVLGLLALAAMLWRKEHSSAAVVQNVHWVRALSVVAMLVLVAGLVLPQKWLYFNVLARSRNFYGMVTVVNVQPDNYLMMLHGVTAHGFQFKAPALQRVPTGYYGKNSGANLLLSGLPPVPARIGLVGMGAGTLAALGRPGDTFRFYEINPVVLKFSADPGAFFTFIKDSAARVEVVQGDARMALEQEAAKGDLQHFDVLVLDAFSSDAIPVHLLTREAFEIYRKHLRGPHSVIAVHITNRVIDLGPVLAGIARENGYAALRTYPTWLTGVSSKSDWVLLSRDPAALSSDALRNVSIPFPGAAKPILWTDEYSNLLQVLR